MGATAAVALAFPSPATLARSGRPPPAVFGVSLGPLKRDRSTGQEVSTRAPARSRPGDGTARAPRAPARFTGAPASPGNPRTG
eukprot:2848530-Alexandrium_andersonii.AAC.1